MNQDEKDSIKAATLEKQNEYNLRALCEEIKDLKIKYYAQEKQLQSFQKSMEMLNNNFAQTLQRVNIVAAQTMGRGPTS